ncbi:MAG: SDR family oxidoreductase [Bacteroidia bacterium]
MHPHFNDKVVIITGSSMGIGKTLALQLAASGAKVVLNGRNQSRLDQTELELKALGYAPLAIQGDISDWDDAKRLIDDTVAHFGRLDLLINNAAMTTRGKFESVEPQVFEKLFQVNVMGSIFTTKAAIEALKASKGGVVMIGSLAGLYGLPFNSLYSMTKMSLTALCQSLRLEFKQYGIYVGHAYVGFTENDPKKELLDANGVKAYLPQREGIKKLTQDQTAGLILKMAAKRKSKIIMTPVGKLMGLMARFAPSFMHRFMLGRMDQFREQSEGELKSVQSS